MGTTKRRYPKEEIVNRGEEIFERTIKSKLKGRNPLDFVLIDIETGDFEVDAKELAAGERLRERIPDAQVYGRRVGSHILRKLPSLRRKVSQ